MYHSFKMTIIVKKSICRNKNGSITFFFIDLNYCMNDEQKAQQYSNLTYGFDRIANEIASIKGESLELNQEQLNKIQKLQEQQGRIMAQLQQIMND